MSSRQSLLAHYARLFTRWPLDRLRPESLHFQRLLQHRIQNPDAHPISTTEANAAYLLLDNAFQAKYPLSSRTMKPASAPEHYEKLARDLEEAPNVSWIDRMVKRLKGLVRAR